MKQSWVKLYALILTAISLVNFSAIITNFTLKTTSNFPISSKVEAMLDVFTVPYAAAAETTEQCERIIENCGWNNNNSGNIIWCAILVGYPYGNCSGCPRIIENNCT